MSNKKVVGAAFGALLGLSLLAPTARAADPDFCRNYAQAAINQARDARTHRRCDRFIEHNPARWNLDFKAHFEWCRSVSREEADRERADRTRELDECARG